MRSFDNGFAFVVGIANYPSVRELSATVLKDAADISALLTDAARCGYPSGQVRYLLDDQASADNIRAGLGWLAEVAGIDDTAICHYSDDNVPAIFTQTVPGMFTQDVPRLFSQSVPV